MAKEKKAHKMHSVKMNLEIAMKLEDFCKETGMTKTAVIEMGTTHFINAYRAVIQKAIANEILNQTAEVS